MTAGLTPNQLVQLSRAVSRVLRHMPWLYELELDGEGWTAVLEVMKDLQSDRSEWAAITEHDFAHMIDTSTKRRFKLCGGKVRALHGHSVAGKPRNLNVYSRTPRLLVGNDGGFREVPASRKGVQYLIELPPRETALLIRERIK